MRKTVRADQLLVGMYVAEVPAPWTHHALWRSKFLIRNDGDLLSARTSGADVFVIDTELGLDAEEDTPPRSPSDQTATPDPLDIGDATVRVVSASEAWSRAKTVVGETFERLRSGRSVDERAVSAVVENVIESLQNEQFALMGLALLKERDEYTFAHSVSVCTLMIAFGQHLKLDADHCRALGTAGLFHDIGKASVDDMLLRKSGPLTQDEYELVKQHTAFGADFVRQMQRTCPIAIDVCLHHHERVDGSGYLRQLTHETLTLESRIASICDVYDAITSDRPYKDAWDPGRALSEMASWKGHFDRSLLASFVSMLSPYPPGAVVRLASGRIGIVIRPSPAVPRKPVVRVFYSMPSHSHLTPRLVDLARTADEIVSLEPEDAWSGPALAHARRSNLRTGLD